MELMKGKQRNPERIKPMLEKLEEAWALMYGFGRLCI